MADLSLEKQVLADVEAGNLFLYSGFIGQRPFVRILVRRVIGPVELLLLSEVGRCRLMMGLEGVGGAI